MEELELDKVNLVSQRLRSKQRLISLLLFIFPSTVVAYILYQQGLLVRLDSLHLLMIFCLLVLALSGVNVLRQAFEKFVMVTVYLKRAENGEAVQMDADQEPADLQAISVSFNRFVARLDDANSKLESMHAELQESNVERRQAVESLIALKKAVDIMQLGVTITDVERRITYTNDAEARMHGYEAQELLGRDARIFAPPECWVDKSDDLDAMKSWQREGINRRRDGSLFPVHLTSDAVTDLDGRCTGIVTTCADITDKKLAEEALRRSERENVILNRIANCFLTVTGEETYCEVMAVIIEALESRYGLFGFIDDNGDLVVPTMPKTVWQECQVPEKSMVFPEATWGENLWARAIRERRAFVSAGPFHTPAGHVAISSFLSAPILFGNETIGLVSVGNREQGYSDAEKVLLERIAASISPILSARMQRDRQERERRRAEEAFKAASTYNRSLIEASIDPLVTINARGEITDVNSATEKVTGRSRAELIGSDFCSYFTDPERARTGYEQTFRQESIRDYSLEVCHLSGQMTPVLYNASIYRDEQGAVSGVLAAVHDITDLRTLENQLRQAQKMEAIGTLTGGIAHDFNNILTAISGFGSLLEMKMAKDDPLYANVTQILAASDRAANLTRSLLAFSRKQQIETRVLNLNDIVAGLEKMLRRFIREDIDLTITQAAGSLPVLVDAGQIDQVLINLVANARDAMPDGGTLAITTGSASLDATFRSIHGYGEPGTYALLVVTDSGMGMAANVCQRIFDPFFSTKEVGKGTGLGLSVCYGIIKQHNGYINCHSEPGKGTIFHIYLPLVSGDPATVQPGKPDLPVGGTEMILLAEDDPTVRELTTNLLQEFGYTVIEARNGEEAVVKYRDQPDRIALCLFDVIMPKLRGWEAYAAIRCIRQSAKVLFMSGYQADDLKLSDLAAGRAELVIKPVEPRQLLRKIRDLLDGGESASSSTEEEVCT